MTVTEEKLTKENTELKEEVAELKRQLSVLKKMAFGSKSEKTKQVETNPEQISLFNEAETEQSVPARKEEKEIVVTGHSRKKKRTRDEIFKDNTSAYLSDAQLSWFAGEMEKAAKTELPIFVFCHQPINGTHGLPYNWDLDENASADDGGLGEQSDAVAAILKKYDNVFYITGHIHAGFKNENSKLGADYATVEYMKNDNGNNVTLVNLPCFANPDFGRGGYLANGCGFVIEAYDSHVLLRARNFGANTWVTRFDVSVDIIKK